MKDNGIPLKQVVSAIEELAPPALAEEWDNVGLILNPPRVGPVRSVLLTIDLTEAVAREAIATRSQLVIAYHPPIFEPLRSLSHEVPLQRTIMSLARAGIAIYSPHTALDAARDGVNDWLAGGVGPGRCEVLAQADATDPGTGRLIMLDRPVALPTLTRKVKQHLGLRHLRVARAGTARRIKRIALCAGAGASALKDVRADAYITGEMGHHDILAAVAAGVHVILSEHTHTERGYLPLFARRLRKAVGPSVTVRVSKKDREPVKTV